MRYGQFCSIARALDLLGERWTLLIVRELLCGSTRFSEIQRGVPRISRTMLSARLRALSEAGVVEHRPGATYALTPRGLELAPLVEQLGVWGQRHLPRRLSRDELDPAPLLWDMRRRVRREAVPARPVAVRFDLDRARRFLVLGPGDATLAAADPGLPEQVTVRGPIAALAGWWRGDTDFPSARRAGLAVGGPRDLARAFPTWFDRYVLAGVPSAA